MKRAKIVQAGECRLLSGQFGKKLMATGRYSPDLLEIIANEIIVYAELDATSEIAGKVISEVTREFMGLTCSTICGEKDDDDLTTMTTVMDLEAIEAMEMAIAENREPMVEWEPDDIDKSRFDMVDGDFWSDSKSENEEIVTVLIDMPAVDRETPHTVNMPENDEQEIVAELPESDEAQALRDYIKGNRNVNTNKKTDQVNTNI